MLQGSKKPIFVVFGKNWFFGAKPCPWTIEGAPLAPPVLTFRQNIDKKSRRGSCPQTAGEIKANSARWKLKTKINQGR